MATLNKQIFLTKVANTKLLDYYDLHFAQSSSIHVHAGNQMDLATTIATSKDCMIAHDADQLHV